MPDPKTLSEQNRAKLDGIVQEMITNKESDDNINFVVNDFKDKYHQKKNSVATSIPAKLDSGTTTGSSGGKNSSGFPEIDRNSVAPGNGVQPDYAVVQSKKKPLQKPTVLETKKEEPSFYEYLKENLDNGLATVSKSFYDAPGLVYDAAAAITNPIINTLTGYKGEDASSDKLARDLGFRNIPSEILQEKLKVSNEKINAYAAKNGGDAWQAASDGNYGNAAKLVAGTTMQSLPIMVAAMASGGQSSALTAIGVSTASTKNAQLKEEHPEMELGKRVLNSANAGIIEAVTGHLFTGASGAVMKKILAEKGVEQGSKIIAKSFKSTIEKSIEKNPLVGAFGEIVEESAVEFGNQLNDMSSGIRTEFDFHAIKNAGLSATGMGGIQTLGVYGAKGYVKAKEYAKMKAVNKEVFKLRNEIENGNLSDENKALLSIRADRLESENKKLLGTEIEKAKTLPTETKTELNTLNAEFEDLKSKFDDIESDPDIPAGLKKSMAEEIKIQANANQKRKTEILSQNDGLEIDTDFSKFDGVEPDFNLENGKISSLPLKEQERLNKLAVEKITGGDKTIEYTKEQVSETANEIYKNEQNPTTPTPEAQPQAEVQKPSEAEKVEEVRDSRQFSQNQEELTNEVSPVENVVATSVNESKNQKDDSGNNLQSGHKRFDIKIDNEIAGEIVISSKKNNETSKNTDYYEVVNSNVSEQNKGIGTNAYKELIKQLDKPLRSDMVRTPQAEKVWQKLEKEGLAKKTEDGLSYESIPETNTPTNGNVQLGASNVGESGNAKQESPIQESVPSSVDGGESKGDVENLKNTLKTIIPKEDLLSIAVSSLKKEGVINFKDIETSGPPLSHWLNKPENLSKDIGSKYKIYEFLKAGNKLKNETILLDAKNYLLDGTNRTVARLALGQTNFNYAIRPDNFFAIPLEETIAKNYYKSKLDGNNVEFVKQIEELLKKTKTSKGDSEVENVSNYIKSVFDTVEEEVYPEGVKRAGLTEYTAKKDGFVLKAKPSKNGYDVFLGKPTKDIGNIESFGEIKSWFPENKNDFKEVIKEANEIILNQNKKPTTKEKIAERIKLSDAKVDATAEAVKAKLKAFTDMFPSADINPDDYKINGFSADAIIDMVAKAAKSIAKGGIVTSEHIKEAINAFNTHFDDEVDFAAVQEKITPKLEAEPKESSKDMEDFRDSWNKDPNPSGEINQYDSGNTIKREHGELRNNQDYEVQKDLARVQIGIKAIEHAKILFGPEYVEKTLSFIEQTNLSPEKKAVAYVLLENEMDARVKEFPENVGVQKLQDLVRAKSQAFLANSARAIGAGRFRVERFRELAKNGFAEEEYTNAILSTKQIKDKEKIQQLSQVTSEEVDNESDLQESDVDFEIAEPTVKRNQKAVKKDISDVLAQMRKDLLKVAKGNVAMSSIPYAAQLQAVTPHVIKLSKLLAELGGMKTKEIITEIHNNIKEMFPEIDKKDVSDILKEQAKKKQKPKTDAQNKTDSIKEVVKQALIASGFGKEITVTKNQKDSKGNNVLDADGKVIRVKGQKQVLDWKKLAGEAGTIENIRKNVESSLPSNKYTKAQKKTMQDALEAEYIRLSADVIQKGLDELVRRNTPRKPVNTKSAARKLAELHNYGLFEKSKDSYEKIINDILGFGTLDQKAFEEMKQIAKGYAVLMDSGLSETETKDAINALSRRQSRLVATLAFSRGDWKFKLANAVSEMTNLSTRFKLVNLGNLIENVNSGIMARAANNMMDAIATGVTGKKTTNKALKKQSSENARAKLKGISIEASESYGDTSSLLLNHSAIEDYFNNATTNKMYHAVISTYMAKPILEGADSFNKLLITEAKFVRATIKVLEAKGMSNTEALDYVSNALTGESMKEALQKSKSLIEKVNKESGKKILNDSESSIKSLASDVVKESLVSGGQISEIELKKIFNAAYKSAGKDIGHVSNNWVTTEISKVSSDNENRLAEAIKEQKWGVASSLVVNQIIWKNFISTFVGGGTNWFVKGLQKAANPLSLISLREDVMRLKMAGELDVTTDEGIKNMEEVLYRGMNLRSTSGTMLMGAIITSSIIGSMMATGADDEIDKWLKENKWAKKYFDKTVPDAVIMMLAIKNKEYGRYIAKVVNVKADFFDDQKNIKTILEKFAKGRDENDSEKTSDAWGELGSMLGKRFEAPMPLRAGKDFKQIYKGLVNGEYQKTDYNTSGFLNGFLQGGVAESWGLRPEATFVKEDSPKGKFDKKQKEIKEFNDLPEVEKEKIRANNQVVSLRGKLTEMENIKSSIVNKTPYYVKNVEGEVDLSAMTIEGINETIANIKKNMEKKKKEAGDRYTEPKE